jgi:hypothetical protein
MSKPQKSAGSSRKANSGNVVLDLGEKHTQKISRMIDAKFAQAGVGGAQKTEMGRPFGLRPGSRFGGRFLGRPALGRPALGAGYRPWFANRRPWMGQDALAITPKGIFEIIPTSLRQVVTGELLTGLGLGLVGNRALMRLTPQLWPTQSKKLVHESIAFAAGLIPMMFKRNATTLGVAVPGAVYLGGTLIDMLFDALNMPKANLSGSEAQGVVRGNDAALAARQKLAAIQQRIQTGAVPQQAAGVPRVFAQAR